MSVVSQHIQAMRYTREVWAKTFNPHPYSPSTLAQQCGEGSFCPYQRFYHPSREECVRLIQRIDPSFK